MPYKALASEFVYFFLSLSNFTSPGMICLAKILIPSSVLLLLWGNWLLVCFGGVFAYATRLCSYGFLLLEFDLNFLNTLPASGLVSQLPLKYHPCLHWTPLPTSDPLDGKLLETPKLNHLEVQHVLDLNIDTKDSFILATLNVIIEEIENMIELWKFHSNTAHRHSCACIIHAITLNMKSYPARLNTILIYTFSQRMEVVKK